MLNSTSSLIGTKSTIPKCSNDNGNTDQMCENVVDGNISQHNLSQITLAQHALEIKRVESVASMSAHYCAG